MTRAFGQSQIRFREMALPIAYSTNADATECPCILVNRAYPLLTPTWALLTLTRGNNAQVLLSFKSIKREKKGAHTKKQCQAEFLCLTSIFLLPWREKETRQWKDDKKGKSTKQLI